MNIFTALWRKATYHSDYSNPDPAHGLVVTYGRWGARTVYDPRVPGYLHARRLRALRDGLDSVDLVLLDPDTIALLKRTAENEITRYVASYLTRHGCLPDEPVPQPARPTVQASSTRGVVARQWVGSR